MESLDVCITSLYVMNSLNKRGRHILLNKNNSVLVFLTVLVECLLRLGAEISYVVKYFEGSNAVKTTSMRN